MERKIIRTTFITLIASVLVFCMGCRKNEQANESIPSKVGEKEVGLTTSDGEYQIWDNLVVDNTTPESAYKAIDGTDLKEWLKKHSNYLDKFPRSLKKQSMSNSAQGTSQGTSVEGNLSLLLNSCKAAAMDLSLREPQVNNFHATFPKIVGQDRFAYVWGASSIERPSLCSDNPPEDEGCACSTPLYGLDCSGFIYQIFNRAGLFIDRLSSSGYAKENEWNKALDKSEAYSGIKVIKVNGIKSIDDCLEGDIIVRSGHHVGVVFDCDEGRRVFNSFGKPSNSCEKNSDAEHGPVRMDPNSSEFNSLFKKGYQVLRFINPFQKYTLSASLRVDLKFFGNKDNPSYGYANYYVRASVTDNSTSKEVSGIRVAFTSDLEKHYQFRHPSMVTPNAEDTLWIQQEQIIPAIKVSATMPDGTYLQQTRKPSFAFIYNGPPLVFGSIAEPSSKK